MPRTVLAALGVLLAPLAGASSLDVEFQAPAQAGPSVAGFNATWALVVFGPATPAAFDVAFPAPSVERNLTLHGVGNAGRFVSAAPTMVPVESARKLAPFAGEASFGQGRGSLYLQGKSIQVRATDAQVDLKASGDCMAHMMGPSSLTEYEARYDDLCPRVKGVALDVQPVGKAVGFQLEAEGLEVVEWHNAAVSCRQAQCPDGGVREEQGWSAQGESARRVTWGYHGLRTRDGSMAGAGQAAWLFLGAAQLDLQVHGEVRLPLATAPPACPDCVDPDGQTLSIEGDVALTDLRLASDGRNLKAGVAGDVQGAKLDEQGIDPAALLGWRGAAVAATALSVGAILGYALAKFAGLFSRVRDPLEHDRTRQAFEAIQGHAGIHLRALVRHLGWSKTTVLHHTRRLLEHGEVVARRQGKTLHFFENHGKYGDDWKARALLRDDTLRRLYDHLQSQPGTTRSALVRQMKTWGWTQRTSYDRLKRLIDAGLVAHDHRSLRVMGLPASETVPLA